MRLTKEERAARKAAFREMSLAGKADYVYAYYKLPVLLGLIALYLICSAVYRQMTKKEAVLYTAFVNVSVGDDLESQLNEGFISASGADPRKMEAYLYRGTYLSDDPSAENHAYGYASKLKLMAAIEAKQLAYLSGCGPKMPAMAADGTPWDKSWITLGGVLGVEKPGYELTLRDDKAAKNMCYAAWSIGDAQPYVNAAGEAANNYTVTDTAQQAYNNQEFTVLSTHSLLMQAHMPTAYPPSRSLIPGLFPRNLSVRILLKKMHR